MLVNCNLDEALPQTIFSVMWRTFIFTFTINTLLLSFRYSLHPSLNYLMHLIFSPCTLYTIFLEYTLSQHIFLSADTTSTKHSCLISFDKADIQRWYSELTGFDYSWPALKLGAVDGSKQQRICTIVHLTCTCTSFFKILIR